MANEQNAASVFPGGVSEQSKNVFTELFGKEEVKPGNVMNTVLEQHDKKNLSFFQDKPKEELTLAHFVKHKSTPGATVLQMSILVLLVTVCGFLSQTSASFSVFGTNPALRVDNFTSQVRGLSAEVQVQNHLAAALLLDQYSSTADAYLYDQTQATSQYTSQNKKQVFAAEAKQLRPQVLDFLSQIQEKLGGAVSAEEIPSAVLVADNLIAQLRLQETEGNHDTLLQDVQDLETAKLLLQNQDFRALINGLDLSNVKDADLEDVMNRFNALNASSASLISTIKATRLEWSKILGELESVVKTVDPLFGTEFESNLTLNDVVFNDDGSVSFSGTSLTSDTTNFTLVSNLIDALEASPAFEKVEDRSYQKSGEADVYTGNFRISMMLSNPLSNE